MKVLMFGWEFPPYISGGLGTACFGLTKGLSQLDVSITFVVPKIKGDYTNAPVNVVGPDSVVSELQVEYEDLKSNHLFKQYKVDSSLHPYMSEQTYSEYLEQLKQRKKFLETSGGSFACDMTGDYGLNLMTEVKRYALVGKHIARRETFDVIHAHDWMTYQAGVEAKKESGRPLVIHVHATEFDRTGSNINSEIYCIEKFGMDMADKIIAVSHRTRDTIIHKYNINPEKVSVVYNAVEKDDLSEINNLISKSAFENDKIVLFLGRITMQKGPEYFIHAANIVLKKMKNVRFVMAGSGDMARKMIEQMAEYRLIDRFHFTGFLNPSEREKLFSMSDLYVMPSVSEPFGITPLEAMKHDIPIIISKQSGVSEILDHVIKVDFWDVDKLATSILNVLKGGKSNNEMVENNRKCLKEINWSNAAKDVLGIYNNCL